MAITTTLNRIRACSPCEEGWTKLLKGLGKTSADDEPLAYSRIVEINGLDDALWCCRAEPQHGKVWRLYAVWCGRQVQHLMTDQRSVAALDVAERHASGDATDAELAAALDAAWDAADAAWAAAWAAARTAARDAAWDAADAAWAAAWAAARTAVRAAALDAAWDAADAAWAAAWAAARTAVRAAARDAADAARTAARDAADAARTAAWAAADAAGDAQKAKFIEMVEAHT